MSPKPQQPAQKKGGAPIVPIIIGVVVVLAIVLIVVFVVKPGSAPDSNNPSAPASSTTSEESTSEKMVGDWKIAWIETTGITAWGNIGAIMGIDNISLTLNSDGTGKMTADGEDVAFKWNQGEGDEFSIEFDGKDQSDLFGDSAKLAFKDNAVQLSVSADEFDGVFAFTKDGKAEGLREVTMEGTKKISSEDELIGTWQLSGMGKDGASIYGDLDAIGSYMPSSMTSGNVKFAKDGKVTIFGEEATWKITSKDNAVITMGDQKLTVKSSGDEIVMNLGQSTDATDDDVIVMFSKKK